MHVYSGSRLVKFLFCVKIFYLGGARELIRRQIYCKSTVWICLSRFYPRTLPAHFTRALYPRTLPAHFTRALYPRTLPAHFTRAIYPRTIYMFNILKKYGKKKFFILRQNILSWRSKRAHSPPNILKKYGKKMHVYSGSRVKDRIIER